MKNARIIAILVAMVMFSTTLFAQVSSNDDIAGSYKMQENPYVKAVKFAVKEGKVIMSAEGFPDTEVAKGKNADEFVLESQNGVITFTRDGGKVKGVKIEAQGVTLAGEKEGASSSSMGDYAATFKMSDNEYVKKIKIDLKDGKLMLSSDANPTEGAVLKASNSADVFTTSIQGYDADIIFSRAGGKVSSIKLSVAGGQVVLTGEKEQ
jgi:HSP20 family molecular chaperone IbpA